MFKWYGSAWAIFIAGTIFALLVLIAGDWKTAVIAFLTALVVALLRALYLHGLSDHTMENDFRNLDRHRPHEGR